MKFSAHALKRIKMRRIDHDLIKLAIKYGTKIYRTGVKFIFVRRKDIPDEMEPEIAEKIEGLVIVMSPNDDAIITVYKNRNALRDIKRKLKRYSKEECQHPPRRIFKMQELF